MVLTAWAERTMKAAKPFKLLSMVTIGKAPLQGNLKTLKQSYLFFFCYSSVAQGTLCDNARKDFISELYIAPCCICVNAHRLFIFIVSLCCLKKEDGRLSDASEGEH